MLWYVTIATPQVYDMAFAWIMAYRYVFVFQPFADIHSHSSFSFRNDDFIRNSIPYARQQEPISHKSIGNCAGVFESVVVVTQFSTWHLPTMISMF